MTGQPFRHGRGARVRPSIVAMGLATAAFALWGLQSAQAATAITVACGDVTGLVNAVNAANASPTATTITLGFGCSYTLTTPNNTVTSGPDVGANGLPVITNSRTVTIKGDDAHVVRSRASGTPAFRIFDIASGASLVLNDIHVEGGLSSSNGCGFCGPTLDLDGAKGGGMYNAGTLTLTGSYVMLNATGGGFTGFGGGHGGDGGGVYNASTGRITMTQGSVSANSTGAGGFGVLGGNGGNGGGIFNGDGVVQLLIGATVSGNATGNGGPGEVSGGDGGSGGGIENEGPLVGASATGTAPTAGLTLKKALVAGNTTGAAGSSQDFAGTGGNGGGVDNIDGAQATLIASAVKLNTAAGDGGGVFNLSPSTVVLKMGTKIVNNIPDNCVGC